MRKLYTYLSMIMGMLFMLSLGTQAQRPIFKAESGKTIYAAIAADPSGYFISSNRGGIVSFNTNTPYADPVNRLCEESEMIIAGALVKNSQSGNKYYAMFANSAGQPSNFCTVDFNTGKRTNLGVASQLTTMFYDEAKDLLYGIGLTAEGGSKLYTINTNSGALTVLTDIPDVKLIAACSTSATIIRAIGADGYTYAILLEQTPIKVNKQGSLKNNAGGAAVRIEEVGQSLFYEGSTLYWLGWGNVNKKLEPEAFISTINIITSEVTKLGSSTESFGAGKIRLTGMCMDVPSEGVGEAEDSEEFYFSISNDDMDGEGGLLKSTLSDPYKSTTITRYTDDMGLGFCSAAMAEGKYYAMRWNSWYRSAKDFCTVDLVTGEATVISETDKILMGMTYDAKNKKMYAVEATQDESGGATELAKEVVEKSILYTIDLTNGQLTKVCEFNGKTFIGIFAAKDGTLYAMDEIGIYSLNPAQATSTEIMTFGTTRPNGLHGQSLVYLRNNLYWLANGYYNGSGAPTSFLAKINLTDKTVTKVGDANGKFGNYLSFTGLCIVPKTKKAKMLSKITMFGDVQGIRPMTDVSTIQTYYYNADNLLSRVAQGGYGYDASKNIFYPMVYTTYKYNEKNQLIQTFDRRYKQSGMEQKYMDPENFFNYTYDEKGNVSKREEGTRIYYLFEYDMTGNKVKETRMQNNGEWYELYTYTFSDFLAGAKNCPLKMESDGVYGNIFTGEYTYDDKFNVTSYTTWNENKSPRNKTEWEYNEDGVLIKKKTYSPKGNAFELSNTTTFVIVDENNIEERPQLLIYYLRSTAEFDGDTAPLNLQIKNVSTEADPNSFELTCDAPENSVDNPAWDLYCDGIFRARVTSLDENGKIKFIDKQLSNDIMHDWFVQTVDATSNQGYNISNTVTMENVQTELAPVTNAEIVSYETIAGKEYSSNFVKISWMAPDTEYAPLGYNVYVQGFAAAANKEGLITGTETTVDFGCTDYETGWVNTVVVEACYAIGNIKSDVFTFDLKKWEEGESIESNTLSSLIQFGKRELIINGEYTSLDMFNTNGAMVKSVNGVRTVDLSSLASGIYMIRISHEGKVDVLKTIIK